MPTQAFWPGRESGVEEFQRAWVLLGDETGVSEKLVTDSISVMEVNQKPWDTLRLFLFFVVLFSLLVEMLLEGQDAQNLCQGGTDDSEMDPSFSWNLLAYFLYEAQYEYLSYECVIVRETLIQLNSFRYLSFLALLSLNYSFIYKGIIVLSRT